MALGSYTRPVSWFGIFGYIRWWEFDISSKGIRSRKREATSLFSTEGDIYSLSTRPRTRHKKG